jgi:hypothetical protein
MIPIQNVHKKCYELFQLLGICEAEHSEMELTNEKDCNKPEEKFLLIDFSSGSAFFRNVWVQFIFAGRCLLSNVARASSPCLHGQACPEQGRRNGRATTFYLQS